MQTTHNIADSQTGQRGGEEGLLAGVRARDIAAFEALYRVYHPRLAKFLVRITGRPHIADDVINETMLVVWQKADTFNGESKLSTWIFAIAYRIGLKTLRRNDEPLEDKQAGERASEAASPEEEAAHQHRGALLASALMELSTVHRAVIELTYFHDMGYREIAQVMDCPVDTVKTRMFHARRHLRQHLSGSAPDWL